MADTTTTTTKSVGMTVLGFALSAGLIFGLVWVASKAWKKGQAS